MKAESRVGGWQRWVKGLSLCACLFGWLGAAPGALRAEAAPAAKEASGEESRLAAIGERLAEAERAIRTRVTRTRLQVAAGRQPDPGLAQDALHLRRLVRFLGARLDAEEEGPEVTRLRFQARELDAELGNLGRFARGERPSSSSELMVPGPGPATAGARGLWGGLAGQVTALPSGVALGGVYVEIYDSAGFFLDWRSTDLAGFFSFDFVAPGTYRARTYNYQSYLDELYDDLPCGGGCDVATGTPITVQEGAVTTGINFALSAGGIVTGRVREAGTELAVGAELTLYDANGYSVDYAGTDSVGRYRFAGLGSGTYYLRAHSYSHLQQVYNGIDCSDGGCDPQEGDPVAVTVGQTTAGIDFSLRTYGAITGLVTDADTGLPVPFLEIDATTSDGNSWGYNYTDSEGRYSIVGLRSGSYRVRSYDYDRYRDELYDDVACTSGGCPYPSATLVPVALGSTAAGIDFDLYRLGSISGVVLEENSGSTVASASVRIWSQDGTFAGYNYTDSSGHYTVDGLHAGTYFATAESYEHQRELFKDLPCPQYAPCDPTTGDPIAVSLSTETAGIDFSLRRLGVIQGRVTDAMTGAALSSYLSVWDVNGYFVSSTYTNALGYFELTGLGAGTYFVHAQGGSTHVGELYDDIICLSAYYDCDPTTGTPVSVAIGAVAGGIDLALQQGPGIRGTVTAQADGAPLAGVGIDVWLPNGQLGASASTDAAGRYFVALSPGSYLVSTDAGLGGIDELFDNLACPRGSAYAGLCDPLRGTPLAVVYGPGVTADFVLSVEGLFADGFESGDLSAWSLAVP